MVAAYADPDAGPSACPVDHDTRQAWLATQQASSPPPADATPTPPPPPAKPSPSSRPYNNADAVRALILSRAASAIQDSAERARFEANVARLQPSAGGGDPSSSLSRERAVSSIPRWSAQTASELESAPEKLAPGAEADSPYWVYPSPQQFYNAMRRKSYDPYAPDMDVVVPIHNAVNERAWQQILQWERMWGGAEDDEKSSWRRCGGPKLVNFQGKPKELTWRAWARTLMGYQAPFDRHDWIVDRCGKRVRYIIDFYSGKSDDSASSAGATFASASSATATSSSPAKLARPLSFFIDVRPAPDSMEGWAMRARYAAKKWFGF